MNQLQLIKSEYSDKEIPMPDTTRWFMITKDQYDNLQKEMDRFDAERFLFNIIVFSRNHKPVYITEPTWDSKRNGYAFTVYYKYLGEL